MKGESAGRDRRVDTFLGRLRRDTRGNTLAIIAAALIPLVAMIGSGVDLSRAYMAQNRLQQACDSGALAARRLLSGPTLTTAVETEAKNYFNFNFKQGSFQTAAFTPVVTVPAAGTVQMSAATTIQTTLMSMFGYQTMDLSATCKATQDFINTDVMLVFDLSGSMNCAPGVGGNCGDVEQTGSKIGALRAASKSLYDTLEPAQIQLHDNNLRLRYGFVNYNSTINVGRLLYAKNPDYLVQSWRYQSRTPAWLDATAYFSNAAACAQAYSYDTQAQQLGYTGVMGGWFNRPTNGRCRVIAQTNGNQDGYTYERSPTAIDVRSYLTSSTSAYYDASQVIGTLDSSGDDRPRTINSLWNGCIEERQTNNTLIDGGAATIAPSDALDLDIDAMPTDDASRWRPMWADVTYYPEWTWPYIGRKPISYCPTEARRLREYYNAKTSFTGYIDGLVARGGTYHDLGMIWGARFVSPNGIFRSNTPDTNDQFDPDNPTKIRGFGVRKYMIFMTDGDMAPTYTAYSAYGVELADGRVMGSPSTDDAALTRRHLQRFRMACNAAKSKGIDVWVVAFATTLTTDMTNCASRPEQASGLSTNAALIAKFQEIGSKIGSLRLSQ